MCPLTALLHARDRTYERVKTALWDMFPTWEDDHYDRYFKEMMWASLGGALARHGRTRLRCQCEASQQERAAGGQPGDARCKSAQLCTRLHAYGLRGRSCRACCNCTTCGAENELRATHAMGQSKQTSRPNQP